MQAGVGFSKDQGIFAKLLARCAAREAVDPAEILSSDFWLTYCLGDHWCVVEQHLTSIGPL